jgi:hypothetical protein
MPTIVNRLARTNQFYEDREAFDAMLAGLRRLGLSLPDDTMPANFVHRCQVAVCALDAVANHRPGEQLRREEHERRAEQHRRERRAGVRPTPRHMPEEGAVYLLSTVEDADVRALLADRLDADVRRGLADLDRLAIMPARLKRQLLDQIGSYELVLTPGGRAAVPPWRVTLDIWLNTEADTRRPD